MADNQAQRDFWSNGPGLKWVRLHAPMERLHANVAEMLLDAAAPLPGARVLDIGCGGGTTTLMAARRVGPAGEVAGVDISSSLTAFAQRMIAEAAPQARTRVVHADAEVDPLPLRDCDLVISRFGVMFFADPVAAFANIRAALRPGGRLVFVCWAPAARNPWFSVPMAAAVERLGPAAPQAPGAPGPMAFADSGRVEAILGGAGFEDIAIETRETTLDQPSLEEAMALLREIGPHTRHMIECEGGPEDLEAILSATEAHLRQWETPAGLRVPAAVHLVRAANRG